MREEIICAVNKNNKQTNHTNHQSIEGIMQNNINMEGEKGVR